MLSVRSFSSRCAAVALPFALVLGASGTALATPHPTTPKPVLKTTLKNPTNARSATFTWAMPAGTTYTCTLDGVTTACTSPKTYAGPLAVRTHAFKVTAKYGAYKPSSASFSWTIDITPPAVPTLTRTSPSSSPAASSTASFTLADSSLDLASYQCSLDGASFTACTTPKALTGLGTGTHTFAAKAVDKAGNVSAASSLSSWVVDVTPPTAPVLTGPGRTTSTQPSVSIEVSADTAGVTCTLDGAATPCTMTSWSAPSALGDGDHTLAVVATDALGNTAAPALVTFTVDTTGPAAPTLVSGPPSLTKATDVAVSFADDEATATFTCTLTPGTSAACSSPFVASGLVDGDYQLSVLPTDSLGNVGTTPLVVQWKVDSSAPATAKFLTTPQAYTRLTSGTFTWTGTDSSAVGFRCSLDNGAYSDCDPATAGDNDTSFSLSGLSEAPHSFSVEARDAALNWSVPVTFKWVVDTTAPLSKPNALGFPAGAMGAVNSGPTFAFGSTDPSVAGFACSLDGGPFVPCASGYHPVVADGNHSLVVATVDQAGNVSSSTITYTWTLDTKRPAAKPVALASLTTPVKVAFSEPVQGVTSSTVGLRLYGGSVLASKVSCLNASGTATSCAGAAVRAALVIPVTRLVPGQKYAVTLGAVHDPAGNLALLTPLTFRALRTLQDSNTAMGQVWSQRTSTSAYGSRYQVADVAGAVASYRFTGTGVTWYTSRGPAMGSVRVLVDGTLKGTVSNYSTVNSWHVARTVTGLTKAVHTLTLVDASRRLVVDAMKVGTTLVSNPVLTTRFAGVLTSLASGGRYGVADQSGDVFALAFRGTSLSWYTVTGTAMGRAKVYVDGVYKGTFDNYASATHYNVRRTWSFTDKVHTIKIVVLGTHRTGAKGSRVAVDRLVVG
jgi:hypothetical protein